MRIDVSMGTFGPGVDQEGETAPGAMAIYPYSATPGVVDPDTDRGERPFAWFNYCLSEGGCVVIDERPASGSGPRAYGRTMPSSARPESPEPSATTTSRPARRTQQTSRFPRASTERLSS
ncbi:hypothetical protein [Streptomyces sp. NPDC057418]|uniref:hypothetical protein n=1 Tax=Streptomyces sp. NPDC057418 TaxID=3346126 RepID=UPI0036A3114E